MQVFFSRRIVSLLLVLSLSLLNFPLDVFSESLQDANPSKIAYESQQDGLLSLSSARSLQEHEVYLAQKQAQTEALRSSFNPSRALSVSALSNPLRDFRNGLDPLFSFRSLNFAIQMQHAQMSAEADKDLRRIAAYGEYYILYDNQDGSVKKITFFNTLPRKIENERVWDAHGKMTTQNTTNMQYNNRRQLTSYSKTSKDGLGNITKTTWKDANYYTGEDSKLNPRAKEGNVASYTEMVELATGEIIERERRNLLYYTETDERANILYVKDQVAGYTEVVTSNQAPEAPREIVWSGATYTKRHFTPTVENPNPLGSFVDKDYTKQAKKEPEILLTSFHEETTVLDLTSKRDVTDITYNEYEEQISYNEKVESLGIIQENEFREGRYDEWGRLYSYVSLSNVDGQRTRIERLETRYTVTGLISYYRERQISPDGFVEQIEYFDAEYNDIGQVIAFTKVTTSDESVTRLRREDIEYNTWGLETSYTDTIEENGMTTIIERRDITYTRQGLLFSFYETTTEMGDFVEHGEVVHVDRTTVTQRIFTNYNSQGQETGFQERVTDPLGITETLTRSGIRRNRSGQIISYNDFVVREKVATIEVPLIDSSGRFIYDSTGHIQTREEEVHYNVEITRTFEGTYNRNGQLVASREVETSNVSPGLVVIRTRSAMEYRGRSLTDFMETIEETGPGLYRRTQRTRTNTQLDNRGRVISYNELLTDEFGSQILTTRLNITYSDRNLELSYEEVIVQLGAGIVESRSVVLRHDMYDREISSQITTTRGFYQEIRNIERSYNALNLVSRTLEEMRSNSSDITRILDQNFMQYSSHGLLLGYHRLESEEGLYVPSDSLTAVVIDRAKIIDRVLMNYNDLGQEIDRRTITKDWFNPEGTARYAMDRIEEDTTESNIRYNTLGLETEKQITTIRTGQAQVDIPQVGLDGYYMTDAMGNLILNSRNQSFELRLQKLIQNQTYNERGQLIGSTEITTSNETPDKTTTRTFSDALYNAQGQLTQYREIFRDQGTFTDSLGVQTLDSTRNIFWHDLEYNVLNQLTHSLQSIVDELGILNSRVRENMLYNRAGLLERYNETQTQGSRSIQVVRNSTHYDAFDRETLTQEITTHDSSFAAVPGVAGSSFAETKILRTDYNALNQISQTIQTLSSSVTSLIQTITKSGLTYGGATGTLLLGWHQIDHTSGSYTGIDGVVVSINRQNILDRLTTSYNSFGQEISLQEKRKQAAGIEETFARQNIHYNILGQATSRDDSLRSFIQATVTIPTLDTNGEETTTLATQTFTYDKTENKHWENAEYDARGNLIGYREILQTPGSNLLQTRVWSDGQYDDQGHVTSYSESINEAGSYTDSTRVIHSINRTNSRVWSNGQYNSLDQLISFDELKVDELGQVSIRNWRNAQYGSSGLITRYDETITLQTSTPQITRRTWGSARYDSLDRLIGSIENITDSFNVVETRIRSNIEYNGLNLMSHYLDNITRSGNAIDAYGVALILSTFRNVEWMAREYSNTGELIRYHETIHDGGLAQTITHDYSGATFDLLNQIISYQEATRSEGSFLDTSGSPVALDILQTRSVSIHDYNSLGQVTNETDVSTEQGSGYAITKTLVKSNIAYQGSEPISYVETLNTSANRLTQVRTRVATNIGSMGQQIGFEETTRDFGTDESGLSIDRTTGTTQSDIILDPLGRLFGYREQYTDMSGVVHTTQRTRMYYNSLGQLVSHQEERSQDDLPGQITVRNFYGATYNPFGQLSGYIEEEQGFGLTTQRSRTGVQYDRNGNLAGYTETVTDRGITTTNIFSHARYNRSRQLTDYRLVSAHLGQTETFDFANGRYNIDGRLISYSFTRVTGDGLSITGAWNSAVYDALGRLISSRETRSYEGIAETITTTGITYDTQNRVSTFVRGQHYVGSGLDSTITQTRNSTSYDGRSEIITSSNDTINDNGVLSTQNFSVLSQDAQRRITSFQTAVTQGGVMQTQIRSGIIYDDAATLLQGVQIAYTDTYRDSRTPDLTREIAHQTLSFNSQGQESSYREIRSTQGLGLNIVDTLTRSSIHYTNGQATDWLDVSTSNITTNTILEAITGVTWNGLGEMLTQTRNVWTLNSDSGTLVSENQNIQENYTYNRQNRLTAFTQVSQNTLDPTLTLTYTLDSVSRNTDGLVNAYSETRDYSYTNPLLNWSESIDWDNITYTSGQATSFDATVTNTQDSTFNGEYQYSGVARNTNGQIINTNTTLIVPGPDVYYNETFTYDVRGRISSRDKTDALTGLTQEAWRGISYNTLGQIGNFNYTNASGVTTTYSGIAYTGLSLQPVDGTMPHPELLWRSGTLPVETGSSNTPLAVPQGTTSLRTGGVMFSESPIPAIIPFARSNSTAASAGVIFRGTTMQTERQGVTYNSNGQVTGYTEVTRIFGNITNPDGSTQEIIIETSVTRKATVYDIFGQEIGFKQIEKDASGIETEVIRSNITRNDLGIVTSFTETRRINDNGELETSDISSLLTTRTYQVNAFDELGRTVSFTDFVRTEGYYNNPNIDHSRSYLEQEETTNRTNTEYDSFGRITHTEENYRTNAESSKFTSIEKTYGNFNNRGEATEIKTRITEKGKDELGNELDIAKEITRTGILRNELGLETSYREQLATFVAGTTTPMQNLMRDYQLERINSLGKIVAYQENTQDFIRNITTSLHKTNIQYNTQGKETSFFSQIKETSKNNTQDTTLLKTITGQNYQYNLFGQLISSKQTIIESIPGKPAKATVIEFGDATYNKLGQLQSYKEINFLSLDGRGLGEGVITLKNVDNIQYSSLGLQTASLEKTYQLTNETMNKLGFYNFFDGGNIWNNQNAVGNVGMSTERSLSMIKPNAMKMSLENFSRTPLSSGTMSMSPNAQNVGNTGLIQPKEKAIMSTQSIEKFLQIEQEKNYQTPNIGVEDTSPENGQFARAMRGKDLKNFLLGSFRFSSQGDEAFITAYDDIKDVKSTHELAKRLTLRKYTGSTVLASDKDTVIVFEISKDALGKAQGSEDWGFVEGGTTLRGAREWTIPNGTRSELEARGLNIKEIYTVDRNGNRQQWDLSKWGINSITSSASPMTPTEPKAKILTDPIQEPSAGIISTPISERGPTILITPITQKVPVPLTDPIIEPVAQVITDPIPEPTKPVAWANFIKESNFQSERQITNQRYDKGGRLIGDDSITRLSTGEIIDSTRSNIQYNNLGQITSLSERGNSNASGAYSFTRTQTLDVFGQATSINETGTRSNGGAYSSSENNITYDDLGRKLTYQIVEQDSLGSHTTNRTSTTYDAQGRVSGYTQTTEDALSNGKHSTTNETRSLVQYDSQNRMTSWTSHNTGTGTDGKAFDVTTQTQVQAFDSAGRAAQYTESIQNKIEGKSTHNAISTTYNSLGQLSSKEVRQSGEDTIRYSYSYDSSGTLTSQRIEHPDYIITLDKWGNQTSIKNGPRVEAQIRKAKEQIKRAQKAAASNIIKYKKQIEAELYKQAAKTIASRKPIQTKETLRQPTSKISPLAVDLNKLKITFKGNTAELKDLNGKVLAQAKAQANTIKINNNITGNLVNIKVGKHGIESLKETNKTGKEVRTESYNYKLDRTGKVKELKYSIKDTEPTSIQTSKGTKSVIASGAKQSIYEASGTIKYDSKGRVTSSEENKTLKSGKKTIYSFHESLTGVQYDRLNQMVSFEKQTSEKGLGIKKYSTTITRMGETDATGKLSHYIENEQTKQGKVKISRTYEATPTYQGDKLLNENRTLTAEKIKQSSGFFSKVMGFLPVLTAFIPGLNIIGAAALSSLITMGAGLATGQSFGKALLGAAIGFGTAIVAAGVRGIADAVLSGSKQIGQAFTNALKQTSGGGLQSGITRLTTTAVMSSVGEKLGPVGSSILGGVLGTITSSSPDLIALGAVKGLASGYISKALGNSTGAQFATAALGGLSDSVIDNSYKAYVNNMNAIKQALQGAKLEREGLYVTGATQTTSDGKISHYTFDGKEFKYQYTAPANAELITKISNTFTGISFAPTTEITGSKTHVNGITTYYDKQGNFTSALPDNQIQVSGKDGKLVGTQLPISMMTLGVGSNLYFSPVSEGDKTLHAIGYVPVGATPVIENNQIKESVTTLSNGDRIIFNAQGQTEALIPKGAEEVRNNDNKVIGSFLMKENGTLLYYDRAGDISYTLSADGTATFPYYDNGDVRQTIPKNVEVVSDKWGNFSYQTKDATTYYNDIGKLDLYVSHEKVNQAVNVVTGFIQRPIDYVTAQIKEGTEAFYEFGNKTRANSLIQEVDEMKSLHSKDNIMQFDLISRGWSSDASEVGFSRAYSWAKAAGLPEEAAQKIGRSAAYAYGAASEKELSELLMTDTSSSKRQYEILQKVLTHYMAENDIKSLGILYGMMEKAETQIPGYVNHLSSQEGIKAMIKASRLAPPSLAEKLETLGANLAWVGLNSTYQVAKYASMPANYTLGLSVGLQDNFGLLTKEDQQYWEQYSKDRIGFNTGRYQGAETVVNSAYYGAYVPAASANYISGTTGKALTVLGMVDSLNTDNIREDEMPGLKAGYGKYEDPARIMSQYYGGIFAPQYISMIRQIETGDSPSWKNYLTSLNPEVTLLTVSPELISRIGQDKYNRENFIGKLFGDEKSGYGVAYPSPFVKWHTSNNILTYGAGVGNDPVTIYQSAKDMADLAGQPVLYVLNPSHKDDVLGTVGEISMKKGVLGVAQDIFVQSLAQKASNMLDATTMAQFNMHEGIFNQSPNARIIHTVHSQGDIYTTNEAIYMDEKERKKVDYITLGGAAFSDPGFYRTDPYAHPLDLVTWVGKLGKWAGELPTRLMMLNVTGEMPESRVPITFGNNYAPVVSHFVPNYIEQWKVGMKKLKMPINEDNVWEDTNK